MVVKIPETRNSGLTDLDFIQQSKGVFVALCFCFAQNSSALPFLRRDRSSPWASSK